MENSFQIASILKLDQDYQRFSQTLSHLSLFSGFVPTPPLEHLLRHLNQMHPKAKMLATVGWRRNNGSAWHKARYIQNFLLPQLFQCLTVQS